VDDDDLDLFYFDLFYFLAWRYVNERVGRHCPVFLGVGLADFELAVEEHLDKWVDVNLHSAR